MYLRRIPWIAMLLIIVLRVAIGWQLFYEGLWKTKTLSSPKPWTSAGYLKNSQGPLRATFRRMAGDADELDWLDSKKVANRWKKWQSRFTNHFDLDKRQKARLAAMVSGPKAFYSDKDALKGVPDGVDLDAVRISKSLGLPKETKAISFDAENGRLVVDGKAHLSPSDYTRVTNMLPKESDDEPEDIATFRTQLQKVYQRSLRLSYIEQVRGQLGNLDAVGSKKNNTLGELKKYKGMIRDYETALASAKQDYQHEHLQKTWGDLQSQRSSLVGPIKAMEAEMKDKAEELLTVKQMQKHGGLGDRWTGLRIADTLTIMGLVVCGFCLIVGLFTRFSAVMAAIMVLSFYLAMPPLPGLPEGPGPEHSLVVNKNLIEVFALIAIASLPTGYWFGLDKFVGRIWRGLRGRGKASGKAATA